jgi:hypothetical protein
MPQEISVLITHYGDVFWVKRVIESGKMSEHDFIKKIWIIDQNRGDAQLLALQEIHPKIELVAYPIEGTGNHDHAASLDRFLLENADSIASTHLLILDSDLIIRDIDFYEKLSLASENSSAVLALEPGSFFLTHPCLMLLHTSTLKLINFKDCMSNLKVDTGRLIGVQLTKGGHLISFITPTKAYGGALGFHYLGNSAYHVTSVSIRQQPSRRVGKSNLWLSMSESLRRWIVFSRIPSYSTRFGRFIFESVRVIYCLAFTLKWYLKLLFQKRT